MRRPSEDDELRTDLEPRRGLLLGSTVALLVVVGAVVVLLAFRNETVPRFNRNLELTTSQTRGRKAASNMDVQANRELENFGPLAIPDGGWPTEPSTLDGMDEVPEGTLQQGTLDNSGDEDETPPSNVMVGAFYIDRYEITNQEYQACVEAGICRPPMELDPDRFGSPRQPVVGINWHDATTYCQWTGKRLPTEAEWERAARGDDRREFPWGQTPPTCKLAIYTECDRYGPADVGSRPEGSGPFGTQDLAGNVWEWVQDWYAPRYYPTDAEGNPAGPPAGRRRVLRGGSWHFGPTYIRAANRHRDNPLHRTPWYGFRCAYSPPPPQPPPPSQPELTDAGPRQAGAWRGVSSNVSDADLPAEGIPIVDASPFDSSL